MFWAFGQLNFDVRYICLIFWPAQNAKFSAAFLLLTKFSRNDDFLFLLETLLCTYFCICLIQTNSSLNFIVHMPDSDQLVFERYFTYAWFRPTRLWTLLYICLIGQTRLWPHNTVHVALLFWPIWTHKLGT